MNPREFILSQYSGGNNKPGQCISLPTIELSAKEMDLEFGIAVKEEVGKMIREGLIARELESRTLIHLTKKGLDLIHN